VAREQLPPVDAKTPGSNLLEVCLRRKWTVIAAVAVCLGAATAYLSLATKIYTSTARLYVEQNGPRLLTPDPQMLVDRSEPYLSRQCEVIKSQTILAQALDENPPVSARLFRGSADPVHDLLKNLTVDLGKKDDIITVDLNSPYPVESARLVNSIVSAYQTYTAQQSQSSAAEALKILQREKDKQEQVLDDRLKEIVKFKQKNGEMFFTNEQGTNILMQNLAMVSEQLTKAKLNAITMHVLADQQNNRLLANQAWRASEEQVVEFQHEFDNQKQEALKINSAQAEFQKMQLEADRTTKLCDLLDSRIKELNVTEDGGPMNIRVLDAAEPPDYPTQPRKSMTLLAGLAAGLILGSGLAVAHDRLDQRIRTPEEAVRMLGLPVVGAIPLRAPAPGRLEPESRRRSSMGCAVYTSPCTALADAYQALGMAVNTDWPDADARTLLVTSADRGEGKSTTCSNLAIAMAQTGRKTLLIDADLRRPAQHEIFAVVNDFGLSDVLARGMRVEHAIREANIDGLSLLTCGEIPLNPTEMLNGPAFARMLERLEEQYDRIIIDSPPILAAPDARVLGAQADAALLVIGAGTARQNAERAYQRLRGLGAHLLGIVLNRATNRQWAAYYDGDDLPRERSFPGDRLEQAGPPPVRDREVDRALTY
jgi:succinoglycan biosynthesis transport protein ExoP